MTAFFFFLNRQTEKHSNKLVNIDTKAETGKKLNQNLTELRASLLNEVQLAMHNLMKQNSSYFS